MKQLRFGRGTWLAALFGCVMTIEMLPVLALQADWKMHIVWVPAREEAKA